MHFKLSLRLHIFCEKVLVAYWTCHYVDRELLTSPTLHHRTDKAWPFPAGWMSFTSELPGRNDRWTFIFMFRSASTYAHWCSFPSFFGWYLDQPKKYLIHFLNPSKLFNAFKRHFEEIKRILQLKATVINKPNTSINLLKYKFSNLCLRKVVIIYRKIKQTLSRVPNDAFIWMK